MYRWRTFISEKYIEPIPQVAPGEDILSCMATLKKWENCIKEELH